MGMKPGYKETEIGVIPENWEVTSCKDICLKIQDGTHFSPDIKGGKYLYITSKKIRFGYLDLENVDYIDEEQHLKIYSRCDVKKGDLLFTKDGASTGNAAINTLDQPFSLLSSVAFLRFKPQAAMPEYFLQQFLSGFGQEQVQNSMAGNAITRLTLAKIRHLRFPLPPLPEQQAIASALSDTDDLIAALEALIAKKQAIKQGAMQELLTGRKRLPGFTGDWEEKRLGDVAKIKTGKRNNEEKVSDGAYPFFVRSDQVERIDSFSYACEAILVPGEGRIGEIFHYINGQFDVHQRVYAITDFAEQLSARFLYAVMRHLFGVWAMQNTVKATVDSLRLPTFTEFKFMAPATTAEQQAIASILSDMDSEITQLEDQLSKTRALKQGMMQELLTGRIRLV